MPLGDTICTEMFGHGDYEGAPEDGTPWVENDNDNRMLRGGSWNYDPQFCRSACRYFNDAGVRYEVFGFRVVCAAAWTE